MAGHIEHARAYAPLLGEAGSVVDLGSGGGVPGLVLAGAEVERRFVLLDAGRRRAAFLAEAVTALGLDQRVTVVEARAEDAGRSPDHREAHGAVVARSFGPPPVTAECAAGLVGVGGRVVVSDPPADRGRWPAEGLATLGLRLGEQVHEPALTVLHKVQAVAHRYPRRPGVPARRPLWFHVEPR